jgi:NAD(P)-dependent dehydrogenase (short-subunit alcohol dehydrogenase family)
VTDLAVVGGATGALGQAIVARLRVAGLGVVAIARTDAALRDLAGADPGIVPLAADLEHDDAVAAIRAVVDSPVRMVVQAAGLPASGDVDALTGADVAAGMNGKVGGFLRLIAGCREHLFPGSRLVVLGGHYGEEPSFRVPLAGMANAALANLVRSLADRWGPEDVTVHLVAPGPVDSPRMSAIAQRTAAQRGEGCTADDVLDEYRARSPLGRLTTIDEVAWAVTTLLAPEAAALHGSSLKLDVGRRRGNA